MNNQDKSMTTIVNHLKSSGFVFQSSQIYGGLANTWDYGPLGTLMIDNLKKLWKKHFIFQELNNVMLDSKILLNSQVWKASGHIDNFSDPVIENKINNKRYRADHIYEAITNKNAAQLSESQLEEFICNHVEEYDGSKAQWTKIMHFNLMFETAQGITEEAKNKIYLRPETAQGIFINFNNVQRAMRLKLPFGIGQIGKSFRNEVTPGNFIFRTREFEQMELEFFTFPNEESSQNDYQYYLKKSQDFLIKLGLKPTSIQIRHHEESELAHYAKATADIEFNFPFGWSELMGIAHRGDFDLMAHNKLANETQKYFDQNTNQFIIPYVIEPSIGVDRLLLALLCDGYEEEKLANDEQRVVLKLAYSVCPYKVAILPLVKKQASGAQKIWKDLLDHELSVTYDETGSIGKRYRRQDAIGTYWCITYDYDSDNDQCVTIRHRDTMEQTRIRIDEIIEFINKTKY